MRKGAIGVWCAVLMISIGWSDPAWAQNPIHKAGRGVTNILTSWIELPKHLELGMQEDNPFTGIGWGVMKGAGLFATRFVLGAYETVSFLVPYPAGYASPYEGLELPDYAWE